MSLPLVGVIGGGKFGKNHVRTLYQSGALGGVAERNDATREALQTEFPGTTYFATHEALLATEVPAVIISTQACTHYAIAKDALLANKDVLVEKPITLDVGEAEELVRLADERGRILMVGHLLIYQPAIQKVKELIDSGVIGEVRSIHQERLNLGRARNVENALWSLGVHDVAVACYLINAPVTDVSFVGQQVLGNGVEDDTYVHVSFTGGAQAHIHSSWLWPVLRRHMTVVGSKGMIVFDETNRIVTLHRKSIDEAMNNVDEGEEVAFEGDAAPLSLELSHFRECVANRTTPKTDGSSAVNVLKILQAASQS